MGIYTDVKVKVAQWLAGQQWPTSVATTTKGLSPESVQDSGSLFPALTSDRMTVYADMDEMDDQVPEGARALDMLADNAVNAPEGVQRSFKVRFDEGRRVTSGVQKIILDVIDRTMLQEKVYAFARESVKYGDLFTENIVSSDLHVVRLMYLNPESMYRNEDKHGLLKDGTTKGEWAFEQYKTYPSQFLAGFYPWQVNHLRWNHSGGSSYGKPQLYSARYPFKKLQAMQEALVINWLTRAFARLLVTLDTTGMSKIEAQKYINEFVNNLKSRNTTSGDRMTQQLTAIKDLVIGQALENRGGKWESTLNDVEVLDTSNSGFWNIDAVLYWRDKFVTATGVPKSHLGLDKDYPARATLQWQDERFSRMIRRVQMMMSGLVHSVVNLELILQGIDPRKTDYVITWPDPSLLGDVERSEAAMNYGKAIDPLVRTLGLSPEYIALKYLGLTPSQWQQYGGYVSPEPPQKQEEE